MKRLLTIGLLVCGLAAQETHQAVISLKHVSPESLSALVATLAGNRVQWRGDNTMRYIVLNGPKDLVEGIEAAVKRFDVPPPAEKNVELTFHLLVASPGETGTAVPPELSGVAQQLRTVFHAKFRILETVAIRSRENRPIQTSGLMASTTKTDKPALYQIRARAVKVSASEGGGSRIRLDELRFSARLPMVGSDGSVNYSDVEISTDIDMKEGQKIVVGKSSVGTGSESLFLVVTGKVAD